MKNWYLKIKECETEIEFKKAKLLLNKYNLEFEKDVCKTIVIKINNKVIGAGSIDTNILKNIVIDEKFRGQGLLNKLVTKLKKELYKNDFNKAFLYTSEKNIDLFNSLGFKVIEKVGKYPVFMEDSIKGIGEFQKNISKRINNFSSCKLEKLNIGSLVMNCNPLTKGHLYLIEKASKENDLIIIFLVREERSFFSYKERLDLLKKGISTIDTDNILVFSGEDYIVSYATFPNYFKPKNNINFTRNFCKLDAKIFGKYIAKPFNIDKRYIGEEPYSKVTNEYNQVLKSVLPQYGVKVIEVGRKKHNDIIISASLIREYIRKKNWEEIKLLVPKTTYDYIIKEFKN